MAIDELWISNDSYWIDMSTAIYRMYTHDGFVIAADGRNKSSDGMDTDDNQKIFPAVFPDACFAYCIAGTASIATRDSMVIDLVETMTNAAPLLYMDSASESLLMLAEKLTTAVNEARTQHLHFQETADSNIFINGYLHGAALSSYIALRHSASGTTHSIHTEDLHGRLAPVGSNIVSQLLEKDDLRFGSYLFPRFREANTLAKAIKRANNQIKAQSSSLALKLDPYTCSGIGGHTHIATVTKANGFKWADGFAPKGV